MTNNAIISECGKYRYLLTRTIESPLRWVKPCLFIMLNPSTADANRDDPTIRKCISFAKRWGCTHLTVVNLFAYRATNPTKLYETEDPIGPLNDTHISNEIFNVGPSGVVVGAWGAHPMAKAREEFIKKVCPQLKCLGKTKYMSPKHPLYLKYDSELINFWQKDS